MERCTCCGFGICPFCLQLTAIAGAVLLGIYLILKPKQAIEMQIGFYKLINWKMEPVSMEREIRNTRIMGAALLIFGLIALGYVLI